MDNIIETCPSCGSDYVENDGDCFVCFDCLDSGEQDELIITKVDSSIIEEWYVCFDGTERKHWIQRCLKQGFYHCYAFKKSPGGQFYILIDPTRSFTRVDMAPVSEEAFQELTNCNIFVKVVVKIDATQDRGHFCRFNCVEVIKSLIGLKSFWTWTPHQLYKRLLKWEVK